VPAFADPQTPSSAGASPTTHATTDPTAAAIATAESTGNPVPVDSLTTATRTTTANPDGSVSTHIDAQPVRARRDGNWVSLDATLSAAGGGRLAPATTTNPITLSGGGGGPLATLTDAGGHSISLTLPFTLPTPEINGASALYQSVIPGVDLQATVDPQGGFSDVLIVQNAQAAADPRLAQLTFAVSADGLAVHQDSTGLELTAPDGSVSYSAPQPLMWDSSTGNRTAGTPAAQPSAAAALDGSGGTPTSSADGPGTGAQVAPLGVTASDTSLTLTPDQQMLTSPSTTWPLYIDPTITAGTTGSKFDQLYMSGSCANTPTTGKAQTNGEGVGYQHWDTTCGFVVERTLYELNISGLASNFVVSKATVNLTETYAGACTHAATLKLRTVHPFDSSTDGDSQPSQSTSFPAVYSDAVTSGSGGLCSGAPVSFNVTGTIQKALTASDWYVEVYNGNESASSSNNDFVRLNTNPSVDVNYDITPKTPTTSFTVPKGSKGSTAPCRSQSNYTWIGATTSGSSGSNISLSTAVASGVRGEKIRADYKIWDDNDVGSSGPVTKAMLFSPYVASPTTAAAPIGFTVQDGHTYGWYVYAADGTLMSGTLLCYFKMDEKAPNTPTVATNSAFPPLSSGNPATGYAGPNQKTSFKITVADPAPPQTNCTITCTASGVTKLMWEMDSTTPSATSGTAVTALTSAGNGTVTATISNVPVAKWGPHTLNIVAVDKAGNVSKAAAYSFFAPWNPDTKTRAGDLDADQTPDLVAARSTGSLAMYSGAKTITTSPTQLATAAQSPDGSSWANFQIAHDGSMTGGSVDDLYAFQTKTHQLFTDENDLTSGTASTAGFTSERYASLDKPGKCDSAEYGAARCAGYDPTGWATTTQIAAPGSISGEGFGDLVTMENGKLWLYKAGSDRTLTDVVLLGDGNWTGTTLITPGTVSGTPTLWARDNATGVLYSYSLATDPATGQSALLHAPAKPAALVSGVPDGSTHLCMDEAGASTTPGAAIDVAVCAASAGQTFVRSTDGTIRVLGLCVEAKGGGTASGTAVDAGTCNGGAAQQWQAKPYGVLQNSASGLCVGDANANTTPGTQLILGTCATTLIDGSQDWNGTSAAALPAPTQTAVGYVPTSKYPTVMSTGDITGPAGIPDGVPDLYLTDASGNVSLAKGVQNPDATVDPQAPTATGDHQWTLADGSSTGRAAADSGTVQGSQPGTYSTTGITWTTDTTLPQADTALQQTNPTGKVPVFNGTTGVITTDDQILTTQAYTVSAWAKLSTLTGSGNEWVAAQGTQYHQAFYLGYEPTKKVWAFTTTTASSDSTTTTEEALSAVDAPKAGTWTHIVGVFNTGGPMALYINGQLAGTATNPDPAYAANGFVTIGGAETPGSTSGPIQLFPGSIADVRLYSAAYGPDTALTGPASLGAVTTDAAASWALDNTIPNAPAQALDADTWPLTPATDAAGNPDPVAADTNTDNPATGPAGNTILTSDNAGATSAATFNGSSDYLSTANPALTTSHDFTIKVTAHQNIDTSGDVPQAATQDVVCQAAGSGSADLCLGDKGPGTPWFVTMTGAGGTVTAQSTSAWADGTDQHLVATYSAASKTVTLYLDSCLADTETVTSPQFTPTARLVTGAAGTSADSTGAVPNAFNGTAQTLSVKPYIDAPDTDDCSPQSAPVITDPSDLSDEEVITTAADPGQYKVSIAGSALPLTSDDLTADGDVYQKGSAVAVDNNTWKNLPTALPDGITVTDASGTDTTEYETLGGALVPLTAAEAASGDFPAPAAVPTAWLGTTRQALPANATLVNDATGTDTNHYVMVGGRAVLVNSDDAGYLGYDSTESVTVPPAWLAQATAAIPADGTFVIDPSNISTAYTLQGGTLVPSDQDTSTALPVPPTWIESLPGYEG
jgi:hypothetical protein